MAEAILFNLTAEIIFKLGSSALRQFGSLWGGVNPELDKLQHSLSAIQAVLHDAEEKQFKDHAVKLWVSRLKDVLYEIDDLIDESSYETLRRQVLAKHRRYRKQVRILFSKFKSNWKIGHKIKEIRERLQAINDDKNQFGFCKNVIERRVEGLRKRRETHSFIPEDEVVGRNDDKEAVIDLLLNSNTKEDIAIVSIVGTGGLGKTALVQSIYNHKRIMTQFQLKLWVCVSDEFDLKIIIQKIIESATKEEPKSFLQIDPLQCELRKQIVGKKYLLVMDDVWNEKKEEWLHLKRFLMGGAKGSRILITTRSAQMTGLEECSNNQEAELDQRNSNLIQIGKEILSRLKGIPLVIRTIGGLLKDNKSERFWLSFKDKELYQVLGQGQDALKELQLILELSYKYLPANLKRCFLYCALFPKDCKLPKNELILLWRAQGFIQPNGNNDDDNYLVDIGDDYFMELLSRSFFQEVEKNDFGDIIACKMHDLMHDLACSITNNECVSGLKGNVIDKKALHIFLEEDSLENQLMRPLSKATHLRTFFSQDAVGSQWNLEETFHHIFRLRTLHLDRYDQIPNAKPLEFIGKLKHLRFLRIRNSYNITYLPDFIMNLYNLETFIFRNSRLKILPNDVGNLINLKHLDLSFNHKLEFLPDSITELCKLEALILKGCDKLKGLPKDIKSCNNLRQLDLSDNESIEFLPDSITDLSKLEELILKRCHKLKRLPKDIKKCNNLRQLDLSDNESIEFLPDSITNLCKLAALILKGCDKLNELPEYAKRLIKLKHLDLDRCSSLTHMPEGLSELIDLQTMNRFVLGKNKGGELKELDGLTKLRGKLSIEHLEFCTSIVDRQMKGKFLQLKSGLQELTLNWRKRTIGDDRLEDMIYESVLDCLQPHSNLQEICIDGYYGVNLCNWVSSKFLGCLVTIRLYNCERLRHLPRFDQFPNLKHLELLDLSNIEYIIVNNDDSVSSSTIFSSLEKLKISNMPKLVSWCKGTTSKSPIIIFPYLSSLMIYGRCPLHMLKFWHAPNLNLLQISDSEDELNVVPLKNYENLTSLYLSKLSKLEYLPESWQHYMTSLQLLSLSSCENLKSLPEWIDSLTSLNELNIFNCENLTLLPEEIRHIHNLQYLKIQDCPILVEKCKKNTGEEWPKIAHVPNLGISS
ncbi:hypothetical protein IC575_002657 [Cucumis melo]|uniref:Disease resistance protein RGA2-like n=2 Tax=Cucumis melo TaxID=3656 RepID=A0ABM3L262_CUCME|nr:disease resistance protein RGA2-like [Cucumis melo]